MKSKTYQTVLDFFSAETEDECKRHLYKYTDCGAWIEFKGNSITLGSIVEGCDFGTAVYVLHYVDGFTGKDVQDRIDAIEAEADALWRWANVVHEFETETWAEQGIDAPTFDLIYSHFESTGRSS